MDIDNLGIDFIGEAIKDTTVSLIKKSPIEFNEENRYLPPHVTSQPGMIDYSVNPYMREIIDCFSVESPVREVNLKKGVQITYSTAIESGAFYYMGHVKTLPIMYVTATKELLKDRWEKNFLPMINDSGFSDIISSSDKGNNRKTGKSGTTIDFLGGGYMKGVSANVPSMMRSASICVMLKDEIDTWDDNVGKDGDPDSLTDDRCAAYWHIRKIFRGSTPLLQGTSKIQKQYLRGDQRKYFVLCRHCGFPQYLRWQPKEKNTNKGGFAWDMEGRKLIQESVRYHCQNCGHAHYEKDKRVLFATEHGAHWQPTADPVEDNIRSYHLPAMYSPIGMQPWSKCVAAYLSAWDHKNSKVIDRNKLQTFYNNILGEPFKMLGAKLEFENVSGHRRPSYKMEEVPNNHAEKYAGGKIVLLTCQVDVHKSNLAISVMGWTRKGICYLIDYFRSEPWDQSGEQSCFQFSCDVWKRLYKMLNEQYYVDESGRKYPIAITLIDANGEAMDTVAHFCTKFNSGVVPFIGRERPKKATNIKHFSKFTTNYGEEGYKIIVDHYKDRLQTVLKKEWDEELGEQPQWHFNAPYDTTDDQLKELTKEYKRKETDPSGEIFYKWYRKSGANNELWDLMVYGHAAIEILIEHVCLEEYELDKVDFEWFFDYSENNKVYFSED